MGRYKIYKKKRWREVGVKKHKIKTQLLTSIIKNLSLKVNLYITLFNQLADTYYSNICFFQEFLHILKMKGSMG